MNGIKRIQDNRRRQQLLSNAVEKIKSKCARDHGKTHVAYCKDCYGELVEMMRSRYLDSKDGWSSNKAGFMSDLDSLFAKHQDFRGELKAIEARIDKEKAKHYRETLPKTAAGRIAEASMGKANFQAALEDEGKPIAFLTEDIRKVVNKDVGNAPRLEDVLSKSDNLTPEKGNEMIVDAFFRDAKTNEIPASCTKYVEKLRSGATLEHVMAAIEADKPARLQASNNMDKHRRTLNELKRAQAAHEQDKMLKAQKRQQALAQVPQVNKELYELPPCNVCSGKVSPEDVIACPACLIFAELSLTKRTVFDSEKCYEEGYDDHVDSAHSCAAGEGCIQLKDEDEEMGGSGEGAVICEECAEQLGQSTIYCSARCASADFQAHREGVHVPNWKGLGIDLDTQGEQLVYDNDEKTKYHVRDISKFVWRLDEAFQRIFKGNNPGIKEYR